MVSRQPAQHAIRVDVPDEPALGRYDYADAFQIRLSPSDPRTAEQFARVALEHAPWPMRAAVRAGWGVLGFRLGPRTSPAHVFGSQVVASEPVRVQLQVESPLMRGVIVGRRPERTRVVVATYVTYARPRIARPLWTTLSPMHRSLTKRLLEHAASDRSSSQAVA